MLVEVFLSVVSLLCLYFVLRKPPQLPPGVWGWPVLGKIPSSSQRFGDQVKELRPRYGDIITWRVGSRVLVFLCNYVTIKRVLAKQEFQERPDFATFLAYGQGDLRGVIVGNGNKWMMHRRFLLRQLRNLGMGKSKAEDTIHEEATLMVQDFKKHTNEDKPLPMSIGVAVFNVIWKMVANTRFEPDDTRAHDFIRKVWDMNHSLQSGGVTIFNYLPWLAACAPVWLRRRWGLQKVQETTAKVNQVAKEFVEEHQRTFDRLHIRDFIDEYLLAMTEDNDHSAYSLEDLYMLANDLLVAGVETTTNTIRWAILYMAKYPEVQWRVQREIDDVIPRGTLPLYQEKVKAPLCTRTWSVAIRTQHCGSGPTSSIPSTSSTQMGNMSTRRASCLSPSDVACVSGSRWHAWNCSFSCWRCFRTSRSLRQRGRSSRRNTTRMN